MNNEKVKNRKIRKFEKSKKGDFALHSMLKCCRGCLVEKIEKVKTQ